MNACEEGEELYESLHKALKAWDFFDQTIGVDLEGVYRRWKQIPHILIPSHVSLAAGPRKPGGLIELLGEASRAYVFGAHGAAIAMCRAITETILVDHFRIPREREGLADVIVPTHSNCCAPPQ